MFLLRILLLPFSILYGIITFLRNVLFNIGVLKSQSFEIPTVSVGNITVGGTGKSPHVEYLIRGLKENYKLATLSRGYRRQTKGFIVANGTTTYKEIGDEPMQFHSKFEEVVVSVDEKRRRGISKLVKQFSDLDVILLDDCFQHRWVKPGLNILLVDYSTIGEKQFMLPTGELREFKSGSKRADAIVVTKSPSIFSPIEKRRISGLLSADPYQKVFFSYIKYKEIIPFTFKAEMVYKEEEFSLKDYKTYVFAGIAKIAPLIDHLKDNSKEVIVSEFNDHHNFQAADLLRIINGFEEVISAKKIIITTEKDAMRLRDENLYPLLEQYPVFYLPIEIEFHEEEESFDVFVENYVQENRRSL